MDDRNEWFGLVWMVRFGSILTIVGYPNKTNKTDMRDTEGEVKTNA